MAAIKTENLTKEFKSALGRGKVIALDRLNLEVAEGEIFGLLGPNGSGKTTTLKLLLNFIRPTAGKAWILNKPSSDVRIKERVGFMPDGPYFYQHLNGEELLDLCGKLFSIKRDQRRKKVAELLELVGLTEARRRPLREYSRGMLQRIGIAQALINSPELLLLDEPTGGLDPIGSRKIRDVILRIKETGKTVFICSHLLYEAQQICDRVGILHQGNLKVAGKLSEVLSPGESLESFFLRIVENE